MNLFEGKTPAERNKTVAALVLGSLAVVTLAYTFIFSGSSPKKKPSESGAVKTIPRPSPVPGQPGGGLQDVESVKNEDPFYGLTALPENPFPPVFGGASSRNIFALYEPSNNPAPPKMPQMPSPVPPPSPTPFPISVQYVASNPNPVYARQGDFVLEVGGDKFTPDSRVLFNGSEVQTEFGGAQRLTARIPAALITNEGQRQIVVRTSDGTKMSNVAMFNVLAPPVPNFNYVGLVARKRYNNDTAMLQDKQSKEYKTVRLDETLGRFKVVSISSREVVVQDTELKFRHSLPFMDEKSAGRSGSTVRTEPYNNGIPPGFDPNVQIQYQQNIPGIPNQYTQQPQRQPQPQKKADTNDDEDDEDN